MMHLHDLYETSLRTWGEQAQYDQAVEECAELIATLKHFRRGKADARAVVDELADVYLMLGQMIYMFGEDAVMQRVDEKIGKLRRLIESEA